MTPRPVSVGVVGVGRMGRLHAGLLAHDLPGARLAGVADADPVAASEVATALGTRAAGTEDLLEDPTIDVVAVCSPTDTHVELIVEAARAGKAVFCEKPISLDLEHAVGALEAVDRAGVPLMIGFNRRFDPAHEEVHRAVVEGRVGVLHLVRISSRDPSPPPPNYVAESGGIFLDMTIHDFDIARHLTASEIVDVYARGGVRVAPWLADYGDIDTAVVLLRHKDGCLSVIDNSRQAVYGFDQRVEVFGSAGMARVENPLMSPTVLQDASGASLPRLHRFFLDRYAESFVREWQAFLDALATGAPSPVSGADGLAPLLAGLAARRSLAENRPVPVEEIRAVASPPSS